MSAGSQIVRKGLRLKESGAATQPNGVANPGRFYRPELDALRFFAFFLVFLHHALPHSATEFARSGWPPIASRALAAIGRAGALGVDLFFALSSYLITELLLREHRATGSVDVRSFYVRRILRIWPLYFFALLVLAPLMPFIAPGDTMPAAYTAAYALLAGNWACAVTGYPASSFALLWSVSIEEQFYLTWPLCFRGLARRGPTSIRAWTIGMLVAAEVVRVMLAADGVKHPGVWCDTFARLDPIAGGALVAYTLGGRTPAWNPAARMALMSCGLGALFIAGGLGPHDGWGSLWTYPLAAAGATAILHATLGLGSFGTLGYWGRSLGYLGQLLVYLGKISFGLYVYHAAALRLAPNPVAGLALTIAVAALSYRYFETPFLRWKERYARVPSRPL